MNNRCLQAGRVADKFETMEMTHTVEGILDLMEDMVDGQAMGDEIIYHPPCTAQAALAGTRDIISLEVLPSGRSPVAATGGASAPLASSPANQKGAGRAGQRSKWRSKRQGAGKVPPNQAGTRCHGCNEVSHLVNECPQRGVHFCIKCFFLPKNVQKMGLGTTEPCRECGVQNAPAYQQKLAVQMQAAVMEEADGRVGVSGIGKTLREEIQGLIYQVIQPSAERLDKSYLWEERDIKEILRAARHRQSTIRKTRAARLIECLEQQAQEMARQGIKVPLEVPARPDETLLPHMALPVYGQVPDSSKELPGELPDTGEEKVNETPDAYWCTSTSDDPVHVYMGPERPKGMERPGGFALPMYAMKREETAPPVCHLSAKVGENEDDTLDICVDSGATLSLLSVNAYNRIKHLNWTTELEPARANLSGASGTKLGVIGWCTLKFKVDNGRSGEMYMVNVLVGDLHGVDMLLGVDFLKMADGLLDFQKMTLRLKKGHLIYLRTTRNMTTETHAVTTPLGDDHQRRYEGLTQGTVHGHATVTQDQEIEAGTTRMIRCLISGRWTDGCDFQLTPNQHHDLGDGIEVLECLGRPWLKGTRHVCNIPIYNNTEEDFTIGKHSLLGDLQPVEEETCKGNVHQPPGADHCSVFRLLHYPDQTQIVSEGRWTGLMKEARRRGSTPRGEAALVVEGQENLPVPGLSPTGGPPRVTGKVGVFNLQGQADIRDVDNVWVTEDTPRLSKSHLHEPIQQRDARMMYTGRDRMSECKPQAHSVRPGHLPGAPEGTTASDKATSGEEKSSPDTFPWQEVPEHLRCMFPEAGLVTDEQGQRVADLVMEFQDIFLKPGGKVGYTDQVTHRIETDPEVPFRTRARQRSKHHHEVIHETVSQMLENGQVRPSKSPWGASVVLVRKKTGELRFCVDFRKLNDQTTKDAYPIPRIEEMLDSLNGAKYFCTLDLASGYWQIAMHPDDIHKTAFITHDGLFEWVVMPFGLCNAPATFCRLMETVFSDILWDKCMVYLDDIITYGKTFQETLDNLRAVFVRLKQNKLTLKAKKCALFKKEVEFLGHLVTDKGILPSPAKIVTLHNMEMPRTVKQIKSFLGFCSYYRRFVPDFSTVAAPLTALTRKNVICNTDTEECRKAFHHLKELLNKAPMMNYVDPTLEFILDTNASNVAIGGCLSQLATDEKGEQYERPIAFGSKTLNDCRRRYCSTKRELYAVIYFMRYWRGFTGGMHVQIRTDHASLVWLMEFGKRDTTCGGMYQRWAFELGECDYHILHRKGIQNADYLSGMKRGHDSTLAPRKSCAYPDCRECKVVRQLENCVMEDEANDPEDEDANCEDEYTDNSMDSRALCVLDVLIVRNQLNATGPRASTKLPVAKVGTRKPTSKQRQAQVKMQSAGVRRSARVMQQKREMMDQGIPVRGKPPARRSSRIRERRAQTPPPLPPVAKRKKAKQDRGNEYKWIKTPQDANKYRWGLEDPSSPPGRSGKARKKVLMKLRDVESRSMAQQTETTDSGYDSKEEQPAIDEDSDLETEEVEQDDPREPIQALSHEWDAAYWIQQQKDDPILKRIKELRELYVWIPPTRNDVKAELQPVRNLCAVWEHIFVDPHGVLCKRVPVSTGHSSSGWLEQKLVPGTMRLQIFQRVHKEELMHLGYAKVYGMMRTRFFWYNMSSDVKDWTAACKQCQQAKAGVKGTRMPLQQEQATLPMERMAIDLAGPFPLTDDGKLFMMVVQDYCSKWIEIFAIPSKEAEVVANVLFDEVLTRYGACVNFHSDQGREFDNRVMAALCVKWGIKKTRTSGYAPWSNGMVERSNRTIKGLLRFLGVDKTSTWDQELPKIRMALNNAVSATTGHTPRKLFFSQCTDSFLCIDLLFGRELGSTGPKCPTEYWVNQEKVMLDIMDHVRTTTGRQMKAQAVCHERGGQRIRPYKRGDKVFRKCAPNQQNKFSGEVWMGPYVVRGVNNNSRLVKLMLPTAGRGRKMKAKWINTSNVKPMKTDGQGRVLMLNSSLCWREMLPRQGHWKASQWDEYHPQIEVTWESAWQLRKLRRAAQVGAPGLINEPVEPAWGTVGLITDDPAADEHARAVEAASNEYILDQESWRGASEAPKVQPGGPPPGSFIVRMIERRIDDIEATMGLKMELSAEDNTPVDREWRYGRPPEREMNDHVQAAARMYSEGHCLTTVSKGMTLLAERDSRASRWMCPDDHERSDEWVTQRRWDLGEPTDERLSFAGKLQYGHY